jgi:PAS domain S-box-containing protein
MNVGERRELEGRFRRRDESTFPVEINVRRIEIGSDDQFVVISRDITDRKQRERELEQRTDELEQLTAQFQEQYRYLFEEAPVMIVETRAEDGTPMIEDCNQRFVDTLGYDKADVVGQPLAEFYVAESEQRLLDEGGYARSLRGEFTREDRELVAADGEPLETLLRAVPRYDINDAIVGTIAFYVDISEQKELQRENDRLDQFTSVVSHDLRNPLNVAQGHLDLARETCDTDHLDQVADAHDRMNALIEDVLTLAREGKAVTDTETIDLAVLTERCWRNVATAEATLETDLSRSLEADEGRLQQLLENLIRNAVEYGGTDVTVTIGELQDGFYVADDGPGIPEDHLDDVLTPGYSTSEEGTGFGLAIVKEVADAHGWETAVSNGSKGGARIEVTGVEFTSA